MSKNHRFHIKWLKLTSLSALIALPILLVTLYMFNQSWTLGGEKAILMWYEHFHQDQNTEIALEDSLLLIDVHSDKQIVNLYEDGLKYGSEVVVNHAHLYRLLRELYENNNYRYIMLDVFLDAEIAQPEDSALYKLIATMPRIVIARSSMPLADSCLYKKAGITQYSTTLWENDFVKYPYWVDGQCSMPLFMYEELTGKQITRKGSLLIDDSQIVQSSTILTFDLVWNSRLSNRRYYSDMLCSDSSNVKIFKPEKTEGKYVLIGDYGSDIHNTFLGEMPGILINYNAYRSLANGHHRISIWYIFSLFFIFMLLVLVTIHHSNFARLVMWLGYPIILGALCMFVYIYYHKTYDILSVTFLFYLLEKIVYTWDNRFIIYNYIQTHKPFLIKK